MACACARRPLPNRGAGRGAAAGRRGRAGHAGRHARRATARITQGRITAEVDLQGRVRFLNASGELLLEEKWRQRDTISKFWTVGTDEVRTISALGLAGREFKPLTGDAARITVRFEAKPGERLYGMGQYQQPNLDLAGCTLELAQRNSQASVPFVVSSHGYGLLWNMPAVGAVHFAANGATWTAEAAREIDYWITAGDTPADIVRNYAQVTGTVPMMPDYALGLWQSKLRYRTQDELLAVARDYHARGIPLAVIVADFFHWPVQGDWRFDEREWPDPAAMTAELKAMGTELLVSIWPTVDHRSENYREMVEKGYLVRSIVGWTCSRNFWAIPASSTSPIPARAAFCGTGRSAITATRAWRCFGWTRPSPNTAPMTSIITAITTAACWRSATPIRCITRRPFTTAWPRRARPRSSA